MKKIAFDVMGNDNGVRAGVEAALDFVEKNLDYSFILVGDKSEISKITMETERIKIIDVKKEVDKNAGARASRNDDNSMAVAINLVKNNEADAVVSSGDSGVYLSMATLLLKRMPGIKRPAFMPIFPTVIKDRKYVMMDVGANIVTTSQMIEQWAKIGSLFSNITLNVKKPRVGIVNIGTEDSKGNDFQKDAHKNLMRNTEINYIGFVEPRNLLKGVVDVALVDGYGGNLILKTMEGSILSILSLIKKELSSKLKYKIGALLVKGAFNNIKKDLDYRNVGAAWLIGLNKPAIKTHGSSDKKSYLGAFSQLAIVLEKDVVTKLKEVMNE
ncbi:MAG: phosphate acyltransferase PlsX [Mycoplasmatales bacterium]|nr:phosphate acyltransferase PlsX [Mycoplasmatales bacterium]